MENGRERRKYFRLNRDCVVKCEKYSIPRNPDSERLLGKARNISSGGILFESKHRFELGDILRLEIEAAGWEKYSAEFYKQDKVAQSKPLMVLGTVVRSELLSDGRYDIGIAFSGIDEGHRWALLKYLKAKSAEKKSQ